MADFNSLLSEIYDITNRPDLVSDTKRALKSATLKVHGRDYFPKDKFALGIQFDTADYTQQLQVTSIAGLERYRQPEFIRKSDVDGTLGSFLDLSVTPTNSLDRYSVNKDNVAYQAGNVINIRSSTSLQYIIFGCWLWPDITESTYTSWIADELPYIIILEAAASILGQNGDDAGQRGIRLDLDGDPRNSNTPGLYMLLDSQITTAGPSQ